MMHFLLTVAALFLIGAFLYGFHLSNLKKKIEKAWLDVYETFQKRQDLLPIAIEIARNHLHEISFSPLIHARQSASHSYLPDRHKIEREHDLKQAIDQLLFSAAKNSALQKDIYFLEIQHDLENVEKEIDEVINRYNERVRKYNRASGGLRTQNAFHI